MPRVATVLAQEQVAVLVAKTERISIPIHVHRRALMDLRLIL